MTEREMLELAAKAMGFEICVYTSICYINTGDGGTRHWNPLRDKADCADMEAKLMIDVMWQEHGVLAGDGVEFCHEPFDAHNNDRQLARMMASTRAAAAIGEMMK
jgi:hypothetical protein